MMSKFEKFCLAALAVFVGLVINIEFFHESIIKYMKHLLSILLVALVASALFTSCLTRITTTTFPGGQTVTDTTYYKVVGGNKKLQDLRLEMRASHAQGKADSAKKLKNF